jgi:predicted phage gp36 major capsid-like protein
VVAWSGGNWERKEIVRDRDEVKILCISNFAFSPVTFRLSRENVTFFTFLRFSTVLCDFNDFRVLPPFLHVLWV